MKKAIAIVWDGDDVAKGCDGVKHGCISCGFNRLEVCPWGKGSLIVAMEDDLANGVMRGRHNQLSRKCSCFRITPIHSEPGGMGMSVRNHFDDRTRLVVAQLRQIRG